ncbi:hypothetical protein [Halopseudomonas maritima]|uniref:hypothetical protein n=1 Tax=Halopseudomonas maritima TaxID=2918528 RepID=UPI001EEC7263|nr:hypothetical protein [Halopseudomonas maritima]UJJ33063.1 hypothetical protein HV822_07930 [Halopseudomonas maritima]
MKVLQLGVVALSCLSLSACLGSSNSDDAPAAETPSFSSSGVYQGLLLTDAGEPLWATALVTEQGPVLGLVRTADDQLLGLFQAQPSAQGPAQGSWLAQGELPEDLSLAVQDLNADSWQGSFSTQALQGDWQLQQYTSAQPLTAEGRYTLMFADTASVLTLAADQRFSLENPDCQLQGQWQQHATEGTPILSLQVEQQQGCTLLGELQQLQAYTQDDALVDQPLLQLLWRSEQQAGASYLFRSQNPE